MTQDETNRAIGWVCSEAAEGAERIACSMQAWADTALDFAILFVAAGTMSMAIVDVGKGLLRLRGRYHRRAVRRWAGSNANAEDQLLELAAGGSGNEAAWWDQSTAQLFARLRAAVDTVLDFPEDFPELYHHVIGKLGIGQSRHDGEEWRRVAPAWRREIQPQPLGASHCADPGVGRPAAGLGAVAPVREAGHDPADLRARLGTAVSRHLDAVQMATEWRWAKGVQAFAVPLGGVLFYGMQFGSGIQTRWALPLSALAGLLAPFAKDVVDRLGGVSLAGRFRGR